MALVARGGDGTAGGLILGVQRLAPRHELMIGFQRLAGRRVHVEVQDHLVQREIYHADLLQQLIAIAASVTVSVGIAASVTVNVIPGNYYVYTVARNEYGFYASKPCYFRVEEATNAV